MAGILKHPILTFLRNHRFPVLAACQAAVFLFLPGHAPAQDAGVSREPPPAWVTPIAVDVDAKPSSNAGDGGIWHLLSDVQLDSKTQSSYRHYAYRYLSESGVQDNSQRSFDFDPVYQTLALHSLRIHRNGKVIDRLADQEIEILDRETGQEDHLFDGHLTALIVLKDIRVGDVLEYAYSIQGENPIYAGHFIHTQRWSWSVTVHDARFRVLWHDERPLRIRTENMTSEALVSETRRGKEYLWQQTDTEPVYEEDDLPGGYTPYAWIEMSDFASWSETGDWARKLYPIPEELPAELDEKVKSIAREADDETKALLALRFVQDNIRYVGSFMGEHSHRPYPLDVVMSRRFGDCKDKSLMLVTMLRHLGLEAYPALVETDFRHAIIDWLPSPFVFDHLVTQLRLDGKTYWLDPTRSYQRGDSLEKIYFPDYGFALVIDSEADALTPIESPGASNGKIDIQETFRLPDYRGSAEFEVKTVYHGRDADRVRSNFASNSQDSIQKDYVDYYAKDYDNIEAVGELETEDDPKANRFTVSEAYRIEEIWEPDDDGTHSAFFFPRFIYNELLKPQNRRRTMPYGLPHPTNVRHALKIVLPSRWDDESSRKVVIDPAFSYKYQADSAGNVVDLTYEYRSLKNKVLPDSIDDYSDAIETAEDVTGYQIWVPNSYRKLAARQLDPGVTLEVPAFSGFQPNWLALIIYFFVFSFGIAAAIALFFWDPKPPSIPENAAHVPAGKGGWLVLFAIGVILGPVSGLVQIYYNIADTGLETWNPLTTPGEEGYHALWAPAILFSGITNLFILPFELLLLVLFFGNRTSFPKLMIAHYFFLLVQSGILAPIYQFLPNADTEVQLEMWTALGQTVIACSIWVPYLLVSRRVKKTFRAQRREAAATSSPPQLPPQLPPPLPTPSAA